jgi:hypothetical protein
MTQPAIGGATIHPLSVTLVARIVSTSAFAQNLPIAHDEAPSTEKSPSSTGSADDLARRSPHERVVTRKTETDEGVFAVHHVKKWLLCEIPHDRARHSPMFASQSSRRNITSS